MVTSLQYEASRHFIDRLIALKEKYGFTPDGQFLEPETQVTVNREHLRNVVEYLDLLVKGGDAAIEKLQQIELFITHNEYPEDPDHYCGEGDHYY